MPTVFSTMMDTFNESPAFMTAVAGGLIAAYLLVRRKTMPQKKWTPHDPDTLVNYDDVKEEKQDKDADHTATWVTKPDACRPIRLSKKGLAAVPPQTVMAVFKRAVKNQGSSIAMKQPLENGDWKCWTWQQYYDDVLIAARAMIKLGVKRHDAVNAIGFNSPEWFIGNMAVIAAGGKIAGIYTTNGPEACQYITKHSEAAIVIVEDEKQMDKFLQIKDNLPGVKAIVQYKGVLAQNAEAANRSKQVQCLTWENFMEIGRTSGQETQRELEIRLKQQQPGECCTLIYTSGTTGNPKAVMISHDNLTWTTKAVMRVLTGLGQQHEHCVSYLPLSHVAAQMLDIHTPMAVVADFNMPFTMWFARPDALKGTLGATLAAVQPTILFGVPRVWEKICEKMKAAGKDTKGVKKALVGWAKGKGLEAYKNGMVGGSGLYPRFYGLADKLVFSKVRAKLGLTRCRMCLTGAAPISLEVMEFFGSLGIPILEVYGMSECSGPQTVSVVDYYKTGSVGPDIDGCELMLDHQEGRDKPGEGEICFRGRHIMMGYMKEPTKTAQAIDPKGFMHSGDVGRVDSDGLLYITGRIKELIITAGGENIAPVPIEDVIKSELPALSNVMMVGDRRKYNVCLVTLRCVQDVTTGAFTDKLEGASLLISHAKTVGEAKKDPKWKAYIEAGLKRANAQAVSRAQMVQKFSIVSEFSTPTGELTPTLKLKRSVVQDKYAKEIDAMYA